MRAQVRYEDVLALIDWKIYIHYVLKYNKTLKDLTDLKWRFLSLSKPTFLSILQLIWIKVWRTNRPCETFVWIDIWRVQKISETVIDLSHLSQPSDKQDVWAIKLDINIETGQHVSEANWCREALMYKSESCFSAKSAEFKTRDP